MPTKKRFFTKTKKETTKEQSITEKLQKGKVEFRTTKRIAKNKEDTKKRPHFPSISRVIPDSLTIVPNSKAYPSLKIALVVVLCVIGIAWNIWVGADLYKNFTSWWNVLLAREKLYEQMATWENITKAYPNYRDAYVKGEIYAYMLGDKTKEQYFLQNLELLDPNFSITKSFEQLIHVQQSAGQ